MKKLFLYFLILFNSVLLSQIPYYYYPVPSGTTNNLNDIRSITLSNTFGAYICGDNGTLLCIKNPDSTCQTILSNTSVKLNNIVKINTENIYAIYITGNNGILLKSTNHGYNWTQQNTGLTNNNLNSGILIKGMDIFSYKYLVVGTNGLIIKKKYYLFLDTTWTVVQSGTTEDLKSIQTYLENNYYQTNTFVWIAGANGTILKSIDTGNTFFQLPSGTTRNLNSIHFFNKDTGIVVGDGGIILKTTNGGTNWIQKISNTSQSLNSIDFYNSYNPNIFIAGNKVVLYSSNFGDTWNIDANSPTYNLFGCKIWENNLWSQKTVFFVGESGKIFIRRIDTTYHTNEYASLEANNIKSFFIYSGIFDQDIRTTNTAGFEWPKGSGKHALFTAGLSIAGYINGELREAMASYKGEYTPGYCVNGNYYLNDYFKIYKVSKTDNAQNNWDWANWGQMVPYGAPFIDVNNNHIYEPAIDTPGVRNAKETIFLCMTDANPQSHTSGEGFGGGTLPLGAEVHMTAWAYDSPGLQDVQFISYDIINKSTSVWNRVKMGIFIDPDLGDSFDDYAGCDTTLKLTYTYNGDNDDIIYGTNPPAVGLAILTSPINRSVTPNKILGMTSSIVPYKYISCESDPNGEPLSAYFMLSGYKKDSTSFLDPTFTPPKKTKLVYPGNPETNTGWIESNGAIGNCHLDSTGTIIHPVYGDRKSIFGSGADNFNIVPGESQKFVIAQLIARGTNNLNSVTRLKQLCDSIRNFYNTNFSISVNNISSEVPKEYKLFQNYPNPFNPVTNIRYSIPSKVKGETSNVKLVVYDILGKEVETLVNEKQSPGVYEVKFNASGLASGVYFYRLVAGDFKETKKMLLIK